MARITTTLTTNTTAFLGTVHKPGAVTSWQGSFFAYGTFGGGTVAWQFSPDGTTLNLLPITDYTGAPITSTAADSFGSSFGNGSTNSDAPKFYVTLSGATSPSITLGYFDNVG